MSDAGLETFKKRPGCTDLGKDYEHIFICALILNLITDKTIKNFHLSSNDNDFGSFDDVAVEIEYSDGHKEIYLMQMKHINTTKTLTKNGLADKRGKFSIQKYFEGFLTLQLPYKCNFVLFTNLNFQVSSGTAITLADDSFSIKTKICQGSGVLTTSAKSRCYQFEAPSTKYDHFFQNFFLYTNQANVDQLKSNTMTKFRQMFNCEDSIFDQYVQFVTKWSLTEGTKSKLSRDLMIDVIVIRLLTPHMMPLIFKDEEVTTKTLLFREAMEKFQITCFQSTNCEKVKGIWGDVTKKLDVQRLNKVNKKYQITSDYIGNVNILNDRDCTKLLWLMGLCPLPIFAHETFDKVVNLCQNRFVLFGETTATSKVFRKLTDVEPNSLTVIIKEFKCSLQGKNNLSLESLFHQNERIRSIITTNELVQMLNDSFKIGGKKEILPIPHIDRLLTRNIISMDFVDKISPDTLFVISNVKEEDERRILDSSINSINLVRMEDFWKKEKLENKDKIVFFTAKDCSLEEVNNLFKTSNKKRKYHQFRLFEGDLEWVRSQRDIADLKEFRREGKSIEQQKLFASPCDNKINIVCADPGMGKSILMKNLKNSSKIWTVLIQPKDHSKYFRDKNSNPSGFIKYILDKTYKKRDKFFDQLLNILVKDRQIVFIWDGLDEAAKENFSVILDIIEQLSCEGYTQWLTSRCNLRNTLENKFGILSRSIEQFDSQQQNSYIERRLNCSKSDLDDIKDKIHSCISLVQYNDILGIPLQIYMFTELFCQNPEKYKKLLSNIFSITDLYSHFVDEKFNICHKIKTNLDESNDLMMQLVDEMKRERLLRYEEAALKTYLDAETLEALKINCDNFLESIQTHCDNVGIIVDVTDDKIPSFLHNSYGEYFAASFLHKHYGKVPNLVNFIFEERYNNIRFLFDLLMAENCNAHIAVLYKNVQVLEKYENNINTKDRGGRNPLHLACSWGRRFNPQNTATKEIEADANVDTPEYQKMVSFLSERCNPFENDGLFHLNSFSYADYTFSLVPVLILSNTHNIHFDSLKNFNDINALLYNAVKLDYSDVFEEIPYLTIDNQRSLLHLSVIHGSVNCLKKILKNPAYKKSLNATDKEGITPFHLACRSGNLDIINTLAAAGVETGTFTTNGFSAIYIAARSDHRNAIQLLLDLGLDINSRNASGQTAFFLACKQNSCPLAQTLIDFGADINIGDSFGYTPLYMACRHHNKDMIKLLLDNHADVNLPNVHGDLPLFMAAWNDLVEVAEWLLEAGADINATNKKGHGPIHAACLNNLPQVLRFLIQRGVNVNTANRYGQTPLHLAVRQHFEEGIVQLLQAGADDTVLNGYGEVFWEMGARYFKRENFEPILARAKGREYAEKFKIWIRDRDSVTRRPKKSRDRDSVTKKGKQSVEKVPQKEKQCTVL